MDFHFALLPIISPLRQFLVGYSSCRHNFYLGLSLKYGFTIFIYDTLSNNVKLVFTIDIAEVLSIIAKGEGEKVEFKKHADVGGDSRDGLCIF